MALTIYELRKTVSTNKKYRFIYELIVDGKPVATRKTNKDYLGCMVDGVRPHRFFTSSEAVGVLSKLPEGYGVKIGLTFNALLTFSKLED